MDIAGTIVTFGDLAIKIKESIEKVGDNEENLADLKQEVLNTVEQLQSLAQEHEDKAPTEQLLQALENLTEQLKTIEKQCQALTRSKGISGFVKAWFKRDKNEAEIKKLKENRTKCCTQFQLLSTARTEGHSSQTKVLAARIDKTAARTEGKADQLITLARKEELQKWFQALDMREKQRATHALRHKDTGRWVLEGTKFVKWKEQAGCLWIRGNSGTGKSVLSSIAIDDLFRYRSAKIANSHEDAPDCAIAYFYFDFRDEKKQLIENMLRSIIMQLSEQSPTPYSILDQRFKSCQGQILPTYNDLLAMLDTVLSQLPGTYIVLDALDECSEHDKLVEFVSTLRGWTNPVHLLVASQPRTIFLESLAFKEASVVVLEPDTTHADILQFVNSELELNSRLKHIKKAKDAAPKIVDKSNGMFRMAACLLQELTRNKVDTDLDAILAELPSDLFGIYTRFLKPVGDRDFVHVGTLLRWLAFSARPVILLELKDALAINHHQWVFEPEKTGRAEAVCDLLEGLVTVGPVTSIYHDSGEISGQVVTFAHSSVNDYIMSQKFLGEYKHDLGEAPSHTFLAQSCVAYLLHFENNPLNSNTLPQYPLARYAAHFWSHHLLRCHDQSVLRGSTMHLLEEGSQQYVAMNCMYDIGWPMMPPRWSWHAPSPLYLCSTIRYVEGVEFLLNRGADVNAAGGDYGSALQAAALRGHLAVVHILLENGADVNAMGRRYGSALQCAAWKGHLAVVHILLEKDADVNAAGGEYGSALQGAASEGHVDIVRILLEKGADVDAAGGEYDSALQGAASEGHVDIVRILLEKGADVDAAGGEYDSALQGAASEGHVDIVRILLGRGAGVNTVDRDGDSVLQVAAWKGHVDIVRLLLEEGADVNTGGGIYGSALQGAARRGHVDTVCILLEHGADVNATGGKYGSALQAAASAWGNQVEMVRVLLEHGADVNTTGGMYGSALAAASARHHKEIAELLREHGALDTEPGWQ
ncbi:ankyrin repeat-containing domain protein [Mycena polygramma]|nr:ankyrin repeat-containing domain protein [Mycena polygramma]